MTLLVIAAASAVLFPLAVFLCTLCALFTKDDKRAKHARSVLERLMRRRAN
ncbi:hypothetical protein [Streptomyces sp. NBC_00470]|uniref:hypothetical protein n=1 Tax=Streptomyces sp. NBC_00470 TaxID=2975753 RepID=UPI002F90A302